MACARSCRQPGLWSYPALPKDLPVVIMEALALGRPVISTYIAGIPELVQPGVNGWLVPAGALEPLVEPMAEALTAAPSKLERMGRAGACGSPTGTVLTSRLESLQTCSPTLSCLRLASIRTSLFGGRRKTMSRSPEHRGYETGSPFHHHRRDGMRDQFPPDTNRRLGVGIRVSRPVASALGRNRHFDKPSMKDFGAVIDRPRTRANVSAGA